MAHQLPDIRSGHSTVNNKPLAYEAQFSHWFIL